MVGGVRSVSHFSAIYDNDVQREEDSFCQSCLSVGIKSLLEKKMYRFNDKTKEPELIQDPDQDNFRQCYNCGDVVPLYEVKHEPKISDFVETTDNPFDFNSEGMGVLNETASQAIANKRNPIKRKYKQRRDAISSVRDDEIRRLLEDGAELLYQNES